MTDHGDIDTFVYRANIVDVIDGDTLTCALDLGFGIYMIRHVRLLDVDTAEVHFVSHESDEYMRGMKHKEFTQEWVLSAMAEEDENEPIHDSWPFYVETDHDQKGSYSRILGTVWADAHDTSLNQALLDEFDDVEAY